MIRVETAAALAAVPRAECRAVVMTMGALHEGHLALVHHARTLADQVVVTIFVNPLQFDDPRDLERYPRDLERDCALLEQAGADVVFTPGVEEVYPGGPPTVTVAAGDVGTVFEGAHRPGHMDGMLTVVLKLLHLTEPHVAVFGAKDAQQAIAISLMVRDLSVRVDIEVAPTVREADGLARSSRNARLSPQERADALVLSRALASASEAARNGAPVAAVLQSGRDVLATAAAVEVDYFAALDPLTAQAVPDHHRGPCIVAVAARVGDTRLIDNESVIVGGEPAGGPAEGGAA